MTQRRGFFLDGARPEDYPPLFRWLNDLDELPLWTVRRKPMLAADLAQHVESRGRAGVFLIIRSGATGEPAGFIDATVRERHEVAEFECYIDERWRGSAAVIAIGGMINHLFASYPIRSLYCQTYAYNPASIRLLRKIGFQEIGRFSEFVWWRDRYWDLVVLCLERCAVEAALNGDGYLGGLRTRLAARGRWEKHPAVGV